MSETPRKSSEERNAEVRAQIRPLAARERPTPLVIAAALCVLLAVGNLIAMAADARVGSRPVGSGPSIVLAALLLGLAAWLWRRDAAAVMVFQGLLILTVLFAFLGVLSAANAVAVIGSTITLGLASWLFWKLIGVLARIQAPPIASDAASE